MALEVLAARPTHVPPHLIARCSMLDAHPGLVGVLLQLLRAHEAAGDTAAAASVLALLEAWLLQHSQQVRAACSLGLDGLLERSGARQGASPWWRWGLQRLRLGLGVAGGCVGS